MFYIDATVEPSLSQVPFHSTDMTAACFDKNTYTAYVRLDRIIVHIASNMMPIQDAAAGDKRQTSSMETDSISTTVAVIVSGQ